jgi:transposase
MLSKEHPRSASPDWRKCCGRSSITTTEAADRLLTSTALVSFVGDAHRFPSGRHFASYLGLTPRERSSGLRRHLGSISKRGDP